MSTPQERLTDAERRIEAARREVRRAADVHAEALREIELARESGASRAVELTYDGAPVDLSNNGSRRRQLLAAQDVAARTESELRRAEAALSEAEAAAREPRAEVLALVREQLAELDGEIGALMAEWEEHAAKLRKVRTRLGPLVGRYAELDHRRTTLDNTHSAWVPQSQRVVQLFASTSGILNGAARL